jgi:NADP-dependent aldehyde dehydrogenase
MLHRGIASNYAAGVASRSGLLDLATEAGSVSPQHGSPKLFVTDLATFLAEPLLHQELFGPSTTLISVPDFSGLERAALALEGQLTATLHATPEDLAGAGALLAILQRKAGRLVLNGFPTGVEVVPSMQHGGPYPASSDERFTSVGSAAILRFARPVSYQAFPESALPQELADTNPRGIARTVDGVVTREPLAS